MKPPAFLASFFASFFRPYIDKHLSKPLQQIGDFGFAKTRRAIAALSLSFFVTLYLILALNAPAGPEWTPAFLGLALCYLVAFVGVVAEWFWGDGSRAAWAGRASWWRGCRWC